MSDDRLQDKRRSSHATKKTNEVIICIIMYISSRWGKIITDLSLV